MKVSHRYTMCKSNGFELLMTFPTTDSGRQLAEKVVSPSKTGQRQGRKVKTTTNTGPLSRALAKENMRPNVVKASLYQQYKIGLEYKEKKTQTKKVNTIVNETKVIPCPFWNGTADDLVLVPKNGNNKKRIRLRSYRHLTITTKTGCILSLVDAKVTPWKTTPFRAASITEVASLVQNNKDCPCYQLSGMKALLEKLKENPSDSGSRPLDQIKLLVLTTLKSMILNFGMASIQVLACRILSHLVIESNDKKTRDKIGIEFGAIQDILECLEYHKDNVVVVAHATRVLRQMILDNNGFWFTNTLMSLKDKMVGDIIQGLCDVTRSFPDEADILGNAFLILRHFRKFGDEARSECEKLFMDRGGIVHTALLAHQSSLSVQAGGLDMFRLPLFKKDYTFECVTPQAIRTLVSGIHPRSFPRYLGVVIDALFECTVFGPAVSYDTIGAIEGAAVFLMRHMVSTTVLDANETVRQRSGIFECFAGVIPYCPAEVVEECCEYVTKCVVVGMTENAGSTDLELWACRVLDTMINKSAKAKRYILRGTFSDDEEGSGSVSGTQYGKGDDVLFAAVQRYSSSNNEVFQAAGKLLFKLREP